MSTLEENSSSSTCLQLNDEVVAIKNETGNCSDCQPVIHSSDKVTINQQTLDSVIEEKLKRQFLKELFYSTNFLCDICDDIEAQRVINLNEHERFTGGIVVKQIRKIGLQRKRILASRFPMEEFHIDTSVGLKDQNLVLLPTVSSPHNHISLNSLDFSSNQYGLTQDQQYIPPSETNLFPNFTCPYYDEAKSDGLPILQSIIMYYAEDQPSTSSGYYSPVPATQASISNCLYNDESLSQSPPWSNQFIIDEASVYVSSSSDFQILEQTSARVKREQPERKKCKECFKSFLHTGDYNKHLMVHTGEKPHKCKYCSKAFPNSSNCRRHERTLHPEISSVQKFNCEYCRQKFNRKDKLKSHMKSQKCRRRRSK